MQPTKTIPTLHDACVHDIAFDHYGTRLATCSSDQVIKVWVAGADGTWLRQCEWKAHYGPVWRVAFAHPEFGQVLASCSFDHNVCVWEEQEGVDDAGRIVSRWHQRAQLSDARDSVNEIKFSPRHMGLKLACGSADGFVRIYEATDPTSLAHWEFAEEFEAEPQPSGGVSCLSWTTGPFDSGMMVVGGGSGSIKVWGFAASVRKWLPMLDFAGHVGRVQDVAWAPNIGRSYHLVATAGADGTVAMWRLQPESMAEYAPALPPREAAIPASWSVRRNVGSTAEAVVVAVFDDHGGLPVWRVEWNVTGTVLACSGDDGMLRLRKLLAPSGAAAASWQTASTISMSAPFASGPEASL